MAVSKDISTGVRVRVANLPNASGRAGYLNREGTIMTNDGGINLPIRVRFEAGIDPEWFNLLELEEVTTLDGALTRGTRVRIKRNREDSNSQEFDGLIGVIRDTDRSGIPYRVDVDLNGTARSPWFRRVSLEVVTEEGDTVTPRLREPVYVSGTIGQLLGFRTDWGVNGVEHNMSRGLTEGSILKLTFPTSGKAVLHVLNESSNASKAKAIAVTGNWTNLVALAATHEKAVAELLAPKLGTREVELRSNSIRVGCKNVPVDTVKALIAAVGLMNDAGAPITSFVIDDTTITPKDLERVRKFLTAKGK